MRYHEAGSGRALLLLHAFPLSADQWLPQLHRVPPGWQFVAPDLRGFRGVGPAFVPTGLDDVTMDDYAEDVVALMNHLDIARAVICGLSMGGYVAFALMRRIPDRVFGLVLADTRAAADSAEGRAGRDAMRALLQRDGPAGVARVMLPRLLGETARRDQPDLGDVVQGMIAANAPEAMAAAIAAMKARPDSTPLLSTLACPTLVICGDEDILTPPRESEAMAAAMAAASFVRLPGAGHLSNLEAPLAFNRALGHFLAGL